MQSEDGARLKRRGKSASGKQQHRPRCQGPSVKIRMVQSGMCLEFKSSLSSFYTNGKVTGPGSSIVGRCERFHPALAELFYPAQHGCCLTETAILILPVTLED